MTSTGLQLFKNTEHTSVIFSLHTKTQQLLATWKKLCFCMKLEHLTGMLGAPRCTCDTHMICLSYGAQNNSIGGAGWQLICPCWNRNNMLRLSSNLWSAKTLSVINTDCVPRGNHSVVLASWEVMYAQTCWNRPGSSHTHSVHTVRWIATPRRINTYQLQWAEALCTFLLILSMVIYCSVLVNNQRVPWNCGQPGEIVEFKTKAQLDTLFAPRWGVNVSDA